VRRQIVTDGGRGRENAEVIGVRSDSKVHVPGVKFSKIHVPSNLREARLSPQWDQWSQAMQEEQDSLDVHDVMEYVSRPFGQKVIPVHWIFSVKVDEHGNMTRSKADWLHKGVAGTKSGCGSSICSYQQIWSQKGIAGSGRSQGF
jgi:hypothetical protein